MSPVCVWCARSVLLHVNLAKQAAVGKLPILCCHARRFRHVEQLDQ